jgi:hypothetical protein
VTRYLGSAEAFELTDACYFDKATVTFAAAAS